MPLGMNWSRWTTNPYYALVILIVACGSIPKGKVRAGFAYWTWWNVRGWGIEELTAVRVRRGRVQCQCQAGLVHPRLQPHIVQLGE